MDIAKLCVERRDELVERWVGLFFASYPLDSKGFMRTNRDRFSNPVGETTRIAAAVLYDAVTGGDSDSDAVKQALHDLVWVRAVQDMPPSKAVGVLYLLKTLLRSGILPECMKDASSTKAVEAYLLMESRIDTLAMMALDMYSDARERVFRVRVEEVKRSQSQVIRLAKLRREQEDPAPETDNRGVEE